MLGAAGVEFPNTHAFTFVIPLQNHCIDDMAEHVEELHVFRAVHCM